MPIQKGGFATGLAQGIFDSLAQSRAKREEQNAEQKRQTLSLLTGMLNQVEPESKPTLLRHIGDVMGLKNKQRGIWERLTGADLNNEENELQGKLSEILGATMGTLPTKQQVVAKTPTQVEGNPFDVRMPQLGYEQVTDRSAMDPNKLYLRDPYSFELEKIQARYALQNEAATERLREKEAATYKRQTALQEDRQLFERDMLERKSALAAYAPLMKRAAVLAGGGTITDEHKEQAAQQMAQETGLKLDLLRETVGLRGAQTALAKFQTQIDPNTGQLMGKAPTMQQNRMFDLQQQQFRDQQTLKADVMKQRYDKAYQNVNRLGAEVQQLSNAIQAAGYKYDIEKGILYDDSGTPITEEMLILNRRRLGLDKLDKAYRERKTAMQELESSYSDATTNYPEYFQRGENVWDLRRLTPPRAQNYGGGETFTDTQYRGPGPVQGATPPGGVNRITGAPPQNPLPQLGQSGSWTSGSERKYNPGEILQVGNAMMQILGVTGTLPDGRIQYKVKRIK